MLEALGFKRISFYSELKYWPFILTAFNVWKGIGFNSLIYYGSLLSIDPSLYEAATIDGCGGLGKLRYITLPHLKQTVIMLVLLSIGNIFRSDYGLFMFLSRDIGILYPVTDVLDSFIIRTLRSSTNIGMSSAMGFLQSIVGFIFVVTANKVVNKLDAESALF